MLTRQELLAAARAVNRTPPGREARSILTRQELLAAAKAVERTPAGKADCWLWRLPRCSVTNAARYLQLHPEESAFGAPEVAVAKMRGDLSEEGLLAALYELAVLFLAEGYTATSGYFSALENDPQRVIDTFIKLASRR